MTIEIHKYRMTVDIHECLMVAFWKGKNFQTIEIPMDVIEAWAVNERILERESVAVGYFGLELDQWSTDLGGYLESDLTPEDVKSLTEFYLKTVKI